ncbi:MAG: glutathione S-transferase family protein [Phenylobacterium sp.]|uniref:glutathione S-transferase family protein n=1 Tax=Phenylobacterium sp. TaxID=1871053 RepID=UPI002728B9E9|nr:glutathione S-transferase family protein [Phenylobacterium sp.]MDO9249307.1 glutathione S-transferase family protein [Phenylobacterium sp.]MDP3632043.1 glutathione S-transferase family protein [Phenylobacterium sp.]
MELLIGTRRWSSWSLRPWLALKRTGTPFTETLIALRQENNATYEAIRPVSRSGLVPALKDGELVVWDSLAICEYLAERFPAAKLWPDDPVARAMGRSASAEMHSGFQALRQECPMAIDLEPRQADLSEATARNVARITELWNELLGRFGGPYLLGDWSIADAFYAPVASRFRTYGIKPTGAAGAYVATILETPEFLEWEAAARAEQS